MLLPSKLNVIKSLSESSENSDKLFAIVDSPIGKLGIQIADEKISKIEFLPQKLVDPQHRFCINHPSASDKLLILAIHQINAYFSDPYHTFTLPYYLLGTEFQLRVWRALVQIPVGTTMTYGALAERLKTHPRAIGQACRSNPLPIMIPCHRIVAQYHQGGFAGARVGELIHIKQWLLRHEMQQPTS